MVVSVVVVGVVVVVVGVVVVGVVVVVVRVVVVVGVVVVVVGVVVVVRVVVVVGVVVVGVVVVGVVVVGVVVETVVLQLSVVYSVVISVVVELELLPGAQWQPIASTQLMRIQSNFSPTGQVSSTIFPSRQLKYLLQVKGLGTLMKPSPKQSSSLGEVVSYLQQGAKALRVHIFQTQL